MNPTVTSPTNSIKQDSHSSAGSDGVSSYSRNKMLAMNIKLKESGQIQKYNGVAWSTKEASALFAPTPAWRKSYSQQVSPSGGGEWRREAQRNFDSRNKVDAK